jgi:CheY-like chemotaxis protein
LPPTVFTYIENDQILLTRALAAGAQAFVQKPFTAAQMDAAMARLAA